MRSALRTIAIRSVAVLGVLIVANCASAFPLEIEGASAVAHLEISDPTLLVHSILTIPRIVAEYATCIRHTRVEDPTYLILGTAHVAPRIIVEYATGITTLGLGPGGFVLAANPQSPG